MEEVGFYNPLTKQRILKGDRVKYWISVGAQPSDTVHNMLVTEKVLEGAKIPQHKKAKKVSASPEAPAAVPLAEAKQPDKAKEES